jgi:toxin ParE1/3/4
MGAKKQLDYSARFIANMEAIRDYIALDNPAAANQVLQTVLSSAEELIDFPLLGHAGQRAGTRELVLPKYPYTLVYRLTADKVRIVAVIHQSRKHPA